MLLSPCPSGSRQREYLSTFINIPHCKQTQAEEHTQPGERSLSRAKALQASSLTSPGCISGESLAGEVTAEIQKFFSIFPEFFQHFFRFFPDFFFQNFSRFFFQNFPRIFPEFSSSYQVTAGTWTLQCYLGHGIPKEPPRMCGVKSQLKSLFRAKSLVFSDPILSHFLFSCWGI